MQPNTSRSMSSLVEKQMRNWEIARGQASVEPMAKELEVCPFVAFSRMVGAGGGVLVRRLAEETGWPLFDREVLQFMAGDDGLRRRLYESLDERDLGFIEESLRGFTTPEFKRNDYFHRLTEAILALARQGNAIFLGRGADLVFPRDVGLRVRLISLPIACVQRYAEEKNLDTLQAAREVSRIERERTRFLRQYFQADVEAVDRFDLTLNLMTVPPEEAVQILVGLMKSRGMIAA